MIEWLGLEIKVPGQRGPDSAQGPWELVRHGVSLRKGSLVFADRRRQRLQVIWTACSQRPDVGQLLKDHRTRQLEQDADARFTAATLPAGWRGLRRQGAADGRGLLRAARYDNATRRLVEVVLDAGDDDAVVDAVIGGLRVTGPADTARRVRAFGLDVTRPADDAGTRWTLRSTRVLPADAALHFDDGQGREVTVRRRAMAGDWLGCKGQTLAAALRAYDPKARRAFAASAEQPHEAEATWNVPGPRFWRLLGRHRVGRGRAWHDAADDAVYELVGTWPARSPGDLSPWAVGPGGRAGGGADHD
ncbi:MAG: hypothetical protein AAGG38_13770 [Planctomycetota bacterium]